MATEQVQVRELFNQPAVGDPPTLEQFSMGGDYPGSVADYARDHLAAIEQGNPMGIMTPDAPRDSILGGVRPPLFDEIDLSPSRSTISAFNEVYSNAWIKGGVQEPILSQVQMAQQATVQDEIVDSLIAQYQDDEFVVNRLSGLNDLPVDEQISVLNYEISRRDLAKISAREALLIHVFRAGHGSLPITQFNKVREQFNPVEMDNFRLQLRRQQTDEILREVDTAVAKHDIGSTPEAILQVLQQDFTPLWNVTSRGLMVNRAFDVTGEDVHWFKRLWPGEMRQEIRDWWTTADHGERLEYIRGIESELKKLKEGPYGDFFTEYGILENFMEIFTDNLLQENSSKNSIDRFIGNLDVVLETVYAAGLLKVLGGRTLTQLYRSPNRVQARRLAKLAGNQELVQRLDRELGVVLRETGEDATEHAMVHMPKPAAVADHREVLPDALKEEAAGHKRVTEAILVQTDDLGGINLNVDDKVNVVKQELDELDSYDTIVLNPKMGVLRALPNDAGFSYTAVYGATPTKGWSNLGDLVDDIEDVLEEGTDFRVMRRNADGELEEVPRSEWPSRARGIDVGEGYGLNNLSDDELLALSRQVDPESDAFKALEEEAVRRASGEREFIGDALREADGEEYFLELDHTRYWATTDKTVLGAGTWRNGMGVIGKYLITPSMRFGNKIFTAFDRAYRMEQATIRRMEQIFKPYYDLKHSDRKVVNKIMEWVEQKSKNPDGTLTGEVPDIADIMAEFEGVTHKQLSGLLSLQAGLDAQWQLFNRRLYREWHNAGYKSATPMNENFPTFHGDVIERPVRGQMVYDPVDQKQVMMTADEIEDLYHNGGGIMKLDLALDIPGEAGKASSFVRLDPEHYRIGKLKDEVLEYTPGYFPRFYEDPYYIVKRSTREVDGKVDDAYEVAYRTAGTTEEADRYLRRFATYNPMTKQWVHNTDPSKTYSIQRVQSLTNTESNLFAKQALNREGRLFWDKRNRDRLPNVYGNRAELEDPVKALNRSTVMAARQTTHEDLMKSMKLAFEKEFVDILPPGFKMDEDAGVTIKRLKAERKDIAEEAGKKRFDKAIEFAEYIRLQQGTDQWFVPFMREQAIRVASWVSRMSGRAPSPTIQNAGFKFSRVLENTVQNMDPLRTMRSATFTLFMILRPARQLVLQSQQVMYLAPLDFKYIMSGRVFRDGALLRRGLMKLTRSNYDDGISSARAAKMMGLTQAQYNRLLEQVDRSGLIDTVDVHAFAGGSYRPKKSYDNPNIVTGHLFGKVKQAMQTYGFDLGEQINLGNTYMVALRRYMKKNKINDLMKLDKDQWDVIADDAMQLALGMTKPNKMWYQSGGVGVMTQFLTFQHRALLGVAGLNPSISKLEAFKILMSGNLLYGAGMFGAHEYFRSYLSAHGLDRYADEYLPGWGGTVVDFLAYGLIQNVINGILSGLSEDFRDLDLQFLAPGANVVDLYKNLLEGMAEAPWATAMGPSGNISKGILEGMEFVSKMKQPSGMTDADKAIQSADAIMRGLVPQYNDVMTSYYYLKTGVWANRSGRVLPQEFEGNWINVLARATLGGRTVEEQRNYFLREQVFEQAENLKSMIDGNRKHLLKLLTLYHDGEIDKEFLDLQMRLVVAWAEEAPPHLRDEILRQSMLTEEETGESPISFMGDNYHLLTPEITSIINEIPGVEGMSQQDKQLLIDTFNDAYYGQSENNTLLLESLKEDEGKWPN